MGTTAVNWFIAGEVTSEELCASFDSYSKVVDDSAVVDVAAFCVLMSGKAVAGLPVGRESRPSISQQPAMTRQLQFWPGNCLANK